MLLQDTLEERAEQNSQLRARMECLLCIDASAYVPASVLLPPLLLYTPSFIIQIGRRGWAAG